jgi:hypothetical protein
MAFLGIFGRKNQQQQRTKDVADKEKKNVNQNQQQIPWFVRVFPFPVGDCCGTGRKEGVQQKQQQKK